MKIYIVRHGETNENVSGGFCGWMDVDLNDNGILLAKQTGKALKGIKFDVAFSSPLSRAKDTAKILLEQSENDCPVVLDDRLKEIHLGDLEGLPIDELLNGKYKTYVKDFVKNPIYGEKFPNGEDIFEVMGRTQEFLKEVAKMDYQTVLITSHGCALRAMLNFLYENKNDFWQNSVPLNCCVNILEVTNDEIKLVEKDVILYDKSLCVDRFKKFEDIE